MELFIEQVEYLVGITNEAGIRLVIHNQTYMPIPEDEGINLQPGTHSSIGISRVRTIMSMQRS